VIIARERQKRTSRFCICKRCIMQTTLRNDGLPNLSEKLRPWIASSLVAVIPRSWILPSKVFQKQLSLMLLQYHEAEAGPEEYVPPCPLIPNPHKQVLQPSARHSTHCQKTGSQPPSAAELDSACYCLSPILQSRLHFLWIVTCQSQYWSAKKIVLLQKKINHKQNIIPWLKGAIYSLMEDIGSLLFVLLQKWALFFDLQKRTFSKGRIMLLQIYVTSFEEETCAGKAIA